MTVPVGREVRLATVARPIPWVYVSFFYSFRLKVQWERKKTKSRRRNRSPSDAINHMSIRGRSLLRADNKLIAKEVKIQVLLLALEILQLEKQLLADSSECFFHGIKAARRSLCVSFYKLVHGL